MRLSTKLHTIDPRAVEKLVVTDVVRELQKAGLRIVADIQRQMSQAKASGRTYPAKGRPKVKHVASAPGQPPAIDTGFYRRSIDFEVEPTSRGVQLRVGTREGSIGQAAALEAGRDDGSMEARPHFGPALEREWPKLQDSLAKAKAAKRKRA